jgi:hypothetical protein
VFALLMAIFIWAQSEQIKLTHIAAIPVNTGFHLVNVVPVLLRELANTGRSQRLHLGFILVFKNTKCTTNLAFIT